MDPSEDRNPTITDDDVDAVLAEFAGDPREAIRALLHDLGALARDADRLVSHGYVRGRQPWRSANSNQRRAV
ncbi:MAG: hypothetical protein EON58_18690 [Alphaproteobacteria bacterium]|nr:MAG: hypothetical protein EON58_18690 [Alphaproteobacteria bacterium]